MTETVTRVFPHAAAPEGALLVGSVPLESAEDVFRVSAEMLGDRLRRMPDGETGPRAGWVGWQGRNFKLDQLELVKPTPGMYPPTPRFRPRPGADLSAISFGELGYANAVAKSYPTFARLKSDGVIRSDMRFQVSLPTPLAPVAMFITDDAQAAIEPLYEARMMDELRRILATVPPEELAIQWDICIEVWMWERWLSAPFADVEQGIVDRVARVSDEVPETVDLGYHICYGDFQHEHFHQPADAEVMTAMASRFAAAARRRVDWVHLPVPIDWRDDACFTALGTLELPASTELYLGVIHARDGEPGARERIAFAQRHVPRFGVACECGMGRRPKGRGGDEHGLRELLRAHRQTSRSVTETS